MPRFRRGDGAASSLSCSTSTLAARRGCASPRWLGTGPTLRPICTTSRPGLTRKRQRCSWHGWPASRLRATTTAPTSYASSTGPSSSCARSLGSMPRMTPARSVMPRTFPSTRSSCST
uniref:Uncharacterized protein n=1 Tax=Ixodes ricinus TaxID=34613 RepID=A0A6B0UMB4_IXORI